MMKFVLIITGVIGICWTAPTSLNLNTDLLDFVQLIPIEDIKIIADKYYRTDKEFQMAIKYIKSDEFKTIIDNLFKTQQLQIVKKYLLNISGIDLDLIYFTLLDLLNDYEIKTENNDDDDNKKSLRRFVQEVRTMLPYQDLIKLYNEKMKNSTYFRLLIENLTGKEFNVMIENLLSTNESQKALDAVESLEIPVRQFIKVIYAFIGWKTSNYL